MRIKYLLALIAALLFSSNSFGQGILTPRHHSKDTRQATQNDASAAAAEAPDSKAARPLPRALPVSAIKINARIDGQVATVRVEHLFLNDTDDLLEGTYYFPVPEGATLLEFALYDGDQRRVGRVKEKEEARAQYAAAAAQGEDPAILEMTRNGWFQSHVYPILPHSEKRIEIIYSQVLPDKDGIVTFDYPLGHGYKKLKTQVDKVEVDVDLRSDVAIKNIFSPTHPLDIHQDGDRHSTCKVTTMGGSEAENFQLVYSLSNEEIGMSLITYRKKGEDGYFLLMLSPRVEFDRQRISAKDVLFVVDVSLSMEGEKIRQAKEALRFGLTRTLNEEDRFNIVSFAGSVKPMVGQMIQANPANIARALDFVDKLQLASSTNINDALMMAMSMFETNKRPHNLVFITDGQPNQSVTDPGQIAANVRAANTTRARLFTFGVGADVNRLLLEKLSAENRGAGSDIKDTSQLGRVVSGFFSKVSQPVLSDMHVDFGPVLVDRMHPAELPDLYTRSQIKIFGRYRNEQDLRDVTIALAGQMSQQPQRFEFNKLHFPLFTDDKDFLPKLWATERVGALLAEIRISGERAELKQEVIDLAREFNLVTPYTSMYVPTSAELARENKNSESAKPASDEPQASPSSEGTVTPEQRRFQSRADEAQATRMGSGNGTSQRRNAPLGKLALQADLSREPGMRPAPSASPGAVVDASGAVIPNATVTIKDQNTGATRTVTTDESGNYDVAGLAPGKYKVEVTAPGFNKAEINDVVVKPGRTSATGVTLSAGGVAESVVVTGGVAESVSVTSVAQSIDFTASHLSSDYESSKIKDLPSLAPVDSLTRLAPGTNSSRLDYLTGQTAVVNKPGEFQFSINGGRARSNGFTLNGHDNNDIDGRPVISIKNFDAVDMLHIITTRGTGDLSGAAASSINLITRSGANDFHGSIFDYYLNRRLGALSPLERRSGLDSPSWFRSDIFGGTFGGPIRRDRVFFFGAFERETATSRLFVDSTSSMLTPTERGLEELSQAFPNSQTVSDLIMRGPLARSIGNPLITRTFMIPVLGVPVEFGEIVRSVPSKASGYEGGTRFDFQITNRDRLEVGYWYDSHRVTNSIGRLAAGYTGEREGRAQLGDLRWTKLISPRSTNDLSFSVNRARLSLNPTNDHSPTSAPQTTPDLLTGATAPGVNLGFRGINYGDSPLLPSSHISTLFEISETLSQLAGRHNLKLGAQVKVRMTTLDYLPGSRGQFTYASFEDFVRDDASALTVSIGDPRNRFSELQTHIFLDDLWRVRSNLIISMGLRYENAGQPYNQLVERLRKRESDPARALFDTRLSLDTRTLQKLDRDKNNIAPRIGFAYTPRFKVLGRNLFGYDKTVIRGGASVSYDQTPYRPLADVAASAPNVLLGVITNRTAGSVPRFQHLIDANDLRSMLGDDPQRFARTALASSFRTPYSAAWHLDASRDFNGKLTFELGYAGSRGAGLIRAINGNPLLIDSAPPAGPVRVYESSGQSIYHSLQARADLGLTERITGGVAYTFSKLIDDLPDSGATVGGGVGNPGLLVTPALQSLAQNPFDSSRGERALSSLDRRHSFNAHFVWDLNLRRGQRGAIGRLLSGWKASGIIEAASGSPFTPLQFVGDASAALFASIFSDRLSAVRPFAGNPLAPVDAVAFSNASNSLFHFFLNEDGSPFLSPTGFIIANRSGYRAGDLRAARFIYNDHVVEQVALSRGLARDAFGNTFAAGRQFGDVGRNTLLGPGLANIDFALLKTTKLSEKVSLQFRSEFFNLFNHPNRAIPNNVLENAGGHGFADADETDATPRRIRIALKLIF